MEPVARHGTAMIDRRYEPGLAFAASDARKLAAGSFSFFLREWRERPAGEQFGYASMGFRAASGEVAFGRDPAYSAIPMVIPALKGPLELITT